MASLSEWAREEAEVQGQRIRHAKQYLRGRGKWIGGRPPYGLRVDTESGRLVPDPETSVYARLIADEALMGRPLVRIARMLNEYEIPSPRGGLWPLDLDPAVAEGVLHVSAMAASCDDDPGNEYPACHVHQQDWGVPVRVAEGGADRLPLVLAGMDDQAP